MERRPLPDALLPHLHAYVATLAGDALLPGGNSQVRGEWEALRARAGMPELTRQDLRATFSTWMQRIAMDNPATRLLEHSSPVTTQTYYTDQELLDKLRVNLLPVDDWLGA